MRPTSILSIILATFVFNSAIKGQNESEEKLEKFQAQKVAYITDQLSFSQKEAQVFWPVYNEYQNRKQAINTERLKIGKLTRDASSGISEKDAADITDKLVLLQKQEALLFEEYHLKFKKILPSVKILKLYQAETQFKLTLLKKLKEGEASPTKRK